MRDNKIFSEEFLGWFRMATQYLGTARSLAVELQSRIKTRDGWGTMKTGVEVPLYLFRHGMELSLKAYSVLFDVPVQNKHDIKQIGEKISSLLPTLDLEDIENGNEPNLIEIEGKYFNVPTSAVLAFALKKWEVELPKMIAKYQTHDYIGMSLSDKNNTLLRYPDNLELFSKLENMSDAQLEDIIKDMNDQFMLLSLVFGIKMSQPLK